MTTLPDMALIPVYRWVTNAVGPGAGLEIISLETANSRTKLTARSNADAAHSSSETADTPANNRRRITDHSN